MAGGFAVELAGRLEQRGFVILSDEGGYVTETGSAFFAQLGLRLGGSATRRPLCRCCLDWSERRFHIGGRLGTALFSPALEEKWVVRVAESRALRVTRAGEMAVAGGLFRCLAAETPIASNPPFKASA